MFCTDASAPFLFLFSDIAPQLLYYSHFVAIVSALLMGIYVYLMGSRNLPEKLLLYISIVFSLWVVFDIVTWVHIDSRIIMIFWALMNLLEPLFFVLMTYFVYAFVKNEDLTTRGKVSLFLPLLPAIIFVSTNFNLEYFDLVECEPIQGVLVSYNYFLELIIFVGIIIFLIFNFFKSTGDPRKKIGLFSLGVLFFLLSFSWANLVGNLTTNWEVTQYGLFGMPVFVAFLSYIIMKFSSFNIKLLGAQALVAGIFILIGSQFFFIRNPINRVLTAITLIVTGMFGWWLVRAVKDEIRQKEEMISLTGELAIANEKLKKLDEAKTEFLSIASHQLRAPLTAIKGFASLLLEGEYGEMSEDVKGVVRKIEISNDRLAQLTENLLNISRIESGRLVFDFMKNNLEELVETVVGELEPNAKKKGIYVKYEGPASPLEPFVFDKNKMHEVFMNLLDNAIKYTQKGGVTIKVEDLGQAVKVAFVDTGIGIPEGDLSLISTKFHRGANARKAHTDGTGIGVYVVGQILKNHNAGLTITSEGENKGSVFTVELDKNFQPSKAEREVN